MSCPKGLTHTQMVTQPEKQWAEDARLSMTQLPQPVSGVHPLHLSPSRQVGLGSCLPCHRVRDPGCQPQSHTLRARLGQGPRRGQPPNAASKGPGNSVQQSSDHGVLPREPAQLELRPPLSGLGLRERDRAPVINGNSGQQIKTPLVGVSMGAGCPVPSPVMS